MRVSLEWIKEFVSIAASPDEIAGRLTMAGLEIEGMEQLDGDVILEVNVTPNRPDCLSMLGVAREVAAAFGLPMNMPKTLIDKTPSPSDIDVVIDDPDLCARYTGRTIRNVTVGESPAWLKHRLEKCGIRAINNVVDITNYVLLELGHPLHAFDADRIAGKKIRVARAGRERRMMTLDGIERNVPEETLLIWDAEVPVAIAGIMGGEGSSVTQTTRDIFLESAYFSPSSIRKSSRALGLKSESSYRFERGTDRVFLEDALNRAALLIAELAGGEVADIVDAYPVPFQPIEIPVAYDKVNALIGIPIEKSEVHRLLNSIGIVTEDRGDSFLSRPPAFRGDIGGVIDIIEEITRCFGYDRIPARIPRTALSDGRLNRVERIVNAVRESVRMHGFDEVINFSFMNSTDLDILAIAEHEHEPRRRPVTLKNPLRLEECHMRTTLLPSLIRNVLYNLSRGVKDIRLFELSKVFIDWGKPLPLEGQRLGGIAFHDPAPVVWKDTAPPFYLVKGMLEALFHEIRLPGYRMAPSHEAFLHAGKSADIYCSEERIGYLGEIGPQVIEQLDIKMQKPQIIVFELDLDLMISLADEKIVYRQIPKFPSIERDVALIIDEGMPAADVMKVFSSYASELIEDAALFDYYKGKNIPPDKKNLGIRVTYRSADRTLTEAELEPVHHGLIDFIVSRTGARIRGAD